MIITYYYNIKWTLLILKSSHLLREDINEIEQEPGDVSDIPIDQIDKEKLDQLRQLISSLPRDQAMQLIENLAKGHANPVNPNNNVYSNTSKKEMLKYKLQQKLKDKQVRAYEVCRA